MATGNHGAQFEVTEVQASESESEHSELTDDPPPPLKVLMPAMTLLLVTVSPCYFLQDYIECLLMLQYNICTF